MLFYSHDQLYKHICMRNHNNDTIITSEDVLQKNIPLTLFERFVCERQLETEQNCNILTPTLMAISVSFPFSCAAQPEAWGPASLGAVFFYHILSPTGLVSKLSIGAWGLPLLGAGFLYRILSPTDLISCALCYIIVHAHSISPHNWPSEYALPPSLERHIWSSSSGNNCHAVHRSLPSGAPVFDCTVGF